jgi:hypothetical protein
LPHDLPFSEFIYQLFYHFLNRLSFSFLISAASIINKILTNIKNIIANIAILYSFYLLIQHFLNFFPLPHEQGSFLPNDFLLTVGSNFFSLSWMVRPFKWSISCCTQIASNSLCSVSCFLAVSQVPLTSLADSAPLK